MKTAMKFVAILMILGLALGFASTRPVYAVSNLYVSTSGNDINDCFTSGTACATIAGAISKASGGETIMVAAGTYSVSSTIIVDKSVTISGDAGAVVLGTGTTATTLSIFKITASDVTIQGLEIVHNTMPAYGAFTWTEVDWSLIQVPPTLHLGGISILNNTIHSQAQTAGLMGTWGGIALTIGADNENGITISGNTVYNTRNGIVIHYRNPATLSDNVVYNTKGGIMNYTCSQADADARALTNNSWGTVHNEWDMVWNSGCLYTMDMHKSVLLVSQANNDAFVLSKVALTTDTNMTGNRSHIFVQAGSSYTTTTGTWGAGNMNQPYATIQVGIDAVIPGGTVIVEPGTYSEKNITVNKSLTLMGDPGDDAPGPGVNAPVVDGGSAPGDAFLLANGVSNVTIKGFEIGNYAADPNPEVNGVGNAIQAWVASTSNITIQDNYLHDLGWNGVLVGNDDALGDHSNWLIKGNIITRAGYIDFELTNTSNSIIEGNIIHLSDTYIGAVFASARRSESGLTVKNNTIDGTPSSLYPVIYMYANDMDMPNPNLDNVVIQGNIINTVGTPFQVYMRNIGTGTVTNVKIESNQLYSVKNLTASALDSSPNWWGQETGPIASQMSGSMTFIPWCTNPECTEFGGPVTNVTRHLGYATIQAAINDAHSGDVLSVAAGTFVENVVVNVPVEIYGAGQGQTFVIPAVSAANPCTGSSLCGGTASNVFLVQVNDVKIHDLTIDGDNPALTSGIVRGTPGADLDARNGIIKNTNATYNNLEVYNTTVKNIYLRGIYSTGGSFNFHDNTVTNVQGDGYSIGMFAWYGPGIYKNNTVSYANDAISANHSSGIQFLNNTVTHSGSGIHTDNSNDAGGTADLIQGNSVDCTGNVGAYGIWTFVPYVAPTINNNVVTNCAVGLSAWGQGAAVITQFTNNTVTGDSSDESVGAYITTDLISYGYTDVSVYFEGNTISGFEYGVQLIGAQQLWNPYPFVAKTINATFFKNKITNYNNSVSKDTGGLAYNANFASNYWGSACGPSNISSGITYSPWYADEAMTTPVSGAVGDYTFAAGTSTAAMNATIACAAPGSSFTFESGNHNGDIQIPAGKNNLTFLLKNDAHIIANSPCFTVNGDYITIKAENVLGASCSPSSGSNGIEVVGARKNLVLEKFEIDGTNGANGIHFSGVMTDLVIADLMIHKNPANGILFDAAPAGTIDIHGNMFRDNTLKGIEAGTFTVPAEYNSWGSLAGPVAGDGISSGVDAIPWTHVDLFLQSSGTPWINQVVNGQQITYDVKANLWNLNSVDIAVKYPANLAVGTLTPGSLFGGTDVPVVLYDDDVNHTLHFIGTTLTGNLAPTTNPVTLFTVTFNANAVGSGTLDLDELTDGFGMAGAGSSSNVYAYALTDGSVNVIELPVMDIVPTAPYIAGLPIPFTLDIANVDGGAYTALKLNFSMPAGTLLEYLNGSTWVTVTNPFNLGALTAGGTLTPQFRVTFYTPGANSLSVSLVDTLSTPANKELATAIEDFTVSGNFSLLGTFSMQGRVFRGGIPVSLTWAGTPAYAPLGSTTNIISDNLSLTLTFGGVYTISTNQPRYLNVTADLLKTVTLSSARTMNSLELKGGNAKWEDNIINVQDAGVIGNQWGSPTPGDGDVNFDGKVNIQDLALVGGNWGSTSAGVYGTWVP